jgi:hypothetical protein
VGQTTKSPPSNPTRWEGRLSESRLKGVNRQNLKLTNFGHALRLGLALELNQSSKDGSPCLEFLNQRG